MLRTISAPPHPQPSSPGLFGSEKITPFCTASATDLESRDRSNWYVSQATKVPYTPTRKSALRTHSQCNPLSTRRAAGRELASVQLGVRQTKALKTQAHHGGQPLASESQSDNRHELSSLSFLRLCDS